MLNQFEDFTADDAVIPCILLNSLIQYASSQHLPYPAWFAHTGLNIDDIIQGNILVSFQTIHDVFLRAQPYFDRQALGIQLVKASGLGSMGLLGFVMQSSKDIAQAFEAGLRFHPISGSVSNLQVILQPEQVILEIQPRYCMTLTTVFIEEVVASIINCLKSLLGQHYAPLRIEFSYTEPNAIEQYQTFFQCPLYFDAARTRIYFSRTLLVQTIPSANTANYLQAIQICEQHLINLTQHHSIPFSQHIRHYLVQHLPRKVTLHELTEQFSLSERQLRRKLAQEQTSFQALRQAVLLQQAKKLLEKNQSIESIGLALGFSDAREFRRAFKRWTNLAPSQFKPSSHIIPKSTQPAGHN